MDEPYHEALDGGYPYNEPWYDDFADIPTKIKHLLKHLLEDLRKAGVPGDEAAELAAVTAINQFIECAGPARVADLLTNLAVSLRRLDPDEWDRVSVEERRGSFRVIEAGQ